MQLPPALKKPNLISLALVVGGGGLILVAAILILIWHSLTDISDMATTTRDEFLPPILERQRTAVNLERLSKFGMTTVTSPDPAVRRTARLAAQMLAQDSLYERNIVVQQAVWNSSVIIRQIAQIRARQDRIRSQLKDRLWLSQDLPREISDFVAEYALPELERRRLERDGRQLHTILLQVPAVDSIPLLRELELNYMETTGDVLEALSTYPSIPGEALEKLVQRLEQNGKVFLYQEFLFHSENEVHQIWTRAQRMLEKAADSLSTGAAVRISDRFSAIVSHTVRAKTIGFLGLTGMGLIIIGIGLFARQHILRPILRATRGLEQVQTRRKPIELPPALIQELDAIQNAVSRFGTVLVQIAERKDELRTINQTLEQEIVQRKKAQEELARAKEMVETAYQVKSRFLASMSHEIRTPLNTILGMAELLWETSLTLEQQSYVQISKSSGESLLVLINDILDLSKIEAGKLVLEEIEFDLVELVESVGEIMAFPAQKKGLDLFVRILPQTPIRILGDPVRIRQILFNLLGNAIKFTRQGSVTLQVRVSGSETGTQCLKFSVRDTGIGIPEEKQKLIFDMFSQMNTSTTREYGGSGLGLAICRNMVELMQGSLEVRSEPARGSEFSFTLPMRCAQHTPTFPPGGPDLAGKTVLVLAEHELCRLQMREILTSWGAAVLEFETPGDLDLLFTSDQNLRLDIALVDATLQTGQGFEAGEEIKTRYPGARVIMLLATDTLHTYATTCLEQKFAQIIKPVSVSRLRDTLTMHGPPALQEAKNLESLQQHVPGLPGRDIHILVVEDSANNRLLIEWYLKEFPCQIDTAENGERALSSFRQRDYDLILMDIQMPVMDGITATREIRRLEQELGRRLTPVIALTANAMQEDEHLCMQTGCSGYLSKPVKKEVLLETICRFVN